MKITDSTGTREVQLSDSVSNAECRRLCLDAVIQERERWANIVLSYRDSITLPAANQGEQQAVLTMAAHLIKEAK